MACLKRSRNHSYAQIFLGMGGFVVLVLFFEKEKT